MDSQGDAGQFRTPRHIIDFIVSIVDPKKEDVILDPACGTAGFLISSYKHIEAANTDPNGNSTLSPDDRERMARNLMGYDISPDMVRLSLVNMYLHGLVDPHIYEYDTLTSEERWNEFADVILANPPFMSPKGGIRPHNRFSVKSKRSEVLFVDYIAEHLNAGGRAGIIVPEGIIFQSQNAHKQLRKKLVEESLVAVVSLPAGVFNPYSGVKTSILVLDRTLARRTDLIAFFKVENDGFDLGAQRRPIELNDLPLVRREIQFYLDSLRSGKSIDENRLKTGFPVRRKRIEAEIDFVLSGERFRESPTNREEHPDIEIDQMVEFFSDGDGIETRDQAKTGIRLIQTGNIGIGQYLDKKKNSRFVSEETFDRLNCTEVFPGDVLVSRLPDPVGRACIVPDIGTRLIAAVDCSIVRFDRTRLIPELFVAYTKSEQYYKRVEVYLTGSTRPRISRKNLAKVQIPLPPLEMQEEIVAEIEGYQKVIDGARAVVENYRPHIHVDPEWPMVAIRDLCVPGRGRVISRRDIENDPGPYPVYSSQTSNRGIFGYLGTYDFDGEYVTWTTDGANAGTVFHRTGQFNCTNVCGTLKRRTDAETTIDMRYLAQVLGQVAKSYVVQVGNPKLMNKEVVKIHVPVPELATQQSIVEGLQVEWALVDANRELIGRFEKKIQDTIARVWMDGQPV